MEIFLLQSAKASALETNTETTLLKDVLISVRKEHFQIIQHGTVFKYALLDTMGRLSIILARELAQQGILRSH